MTTKNTIIGFESISTIHKKLTDLSADRELVTNEIHRPNAFYGHAFQLKRYAGFPQNVPLKLMLQHAPMQIDYVWPLEANSPLPTYLCASNHYADVFSTASGKRTIPIGSFIQYTEGFEKARHSKPPEKTLLVFPLHSTNHYEYSYSMDNLIAYLGHQEAYFERIRVCVYWKDILRGDHQKYMEAGYDIVCAGHMFDQQFLTRLVKIIGDCTHSVTMFPGSNLLFTTLMDRPTYLHELPFTQSSTDEKYQKMRDEKDSAPNRYLALSRQLFAEDYGEITPQQHAHVHEVLGRNNLKTPAEIKSLLQETEDLYNKTKGTPQFTIPVMKQNQEIDCGGVDNLALMRRAIKAISGGDNASAIEYIDKMKNGRKTIENTELIRAIALYRLNRHEEAWEAVSKELEIYPNNKDALTMHKNMQKHFSDTKQAPQNPHMQTVTLPTTENVKQYERNRNSNSNLAFELMQDATKVQDQEFQSIFKLIKPYTMLSEDRLFSLFTLARRACEENVPGNFVECGVAGGGSTALLAYIIKKYSNQPRYVFAFDSFEGMPAPGEFDKHKGISANQTAWGEGTCSAPIESVKEICTKLGAIDLLRPVRGLFEQTLPVFRNKIGMIALLHADGDWYESTKTIFENLYNRLSNQAFIQVDDYGHWEGCKRAIHEFEDERGFIFDLNKIDYTGVWFRRPDAFSINPDISETLLYQFYDDDPAAKGIISQMSPNERFQLYYAARNLLPGGTEDPLRYIEIGTWEGASLRLLNAAMKRTGRNHHGYAVEVNLKKQMQIVLNEIGTEAAHIKMFSGEAIHELRRIFNQEDTAPELIFVDGDHSYEGVKQDILNYYPLLAPGGVMIFHDFLPPLDSENREAVYSHYAGKEPGIRRACLELMEDQFGAIRLDLPLLFPDDPTPTQAQLPLIPGVYSTIRVYRKLK